jgi:hypothetical protein
VQAIQASAQFADRDYELTCSFDYRGGMEGVRFALGDSLRGFCAFVKGGELVVHYDGGFLVKRDLRLPITPGKQVLTLSHKAKGRRQGAGRSNTPAGSTG